MALQRVKVTGFCDVIDKSHGPRDITYFRPEDQFVYDAVPAAAVVMTFAKARGYFPSGKRGASPERCDPVYQMIEAHESPVGLIAG